MLRLDSNLPKIASCALSAFTVAMLIATVAQYRGEVTKAEVGANLSFAAIEADRHAAADTPKLIRVRRKAFADLRRFSVAGSASEALANMLEHLQRLAKTYDVVVAGMDVAETPPLPKPPQPAQKAGLTGESVVLRVRGAFRNLLLFERHLSSDGTLVRVDAMEFSSTAAPRQRVVVSSIVRARLFYVAAENGVTP